MKNGWTADTASLNVLDKWYENNSYRCCHDSNICHSCSSYGGFEAKEQTSSSIHITLLGIGMVCVVAFISGLAGVYSEYILKNRLDVSI